MSSGLFPLLAKGNELCAQSDLSSTIVKDSRQQQKTVSAVSRDEGSCIEAEEPRKRPGRLREKLKYQTASTRFDSSAEEDEGKGPEDTLQRDAASGTHWNTALQKVRIPVRESYDFFTRVTWLEDFQATAPIGRLEGSPERTKATQKPSKNSGPKSDETKASSVGEGKPLTLKDDQTKDNESSCSQIGLLEEAKWHITKKPAQVYIPLQTRLRHDAGTLFSPSILPGDVEERISGTTDIRNLEDEGLFIGQKPSIEVTNLNIMHNRLQQHNEKYWFGEERKLLLEDNPVSDKLHHHFKQEGGKESEQICRFVKPVPMDLILMSPSSQGMEGSCGVLEIELGSVFFSHHPLFTQEHVLSAQLTSAFNSYSRRINSHVTEVLEKRLSALRQSMSKLVQINPRRISRMRTRSFIKAEIDHQRRLELYNQEIRVCREQFLCEAVKDRNLLANILKIWKELKDIRAKQNYWCTSTHLNIKKKEIENVEAKKMWKEGLQIEMKECLEEYERHYANQMALYKIKLEEWKNQHKERKEAKQQLKNIQRNSFRSEEALLQVTRDEALLSVLEPERPQPPTVLSREKIEENVLKSYEKTQRPPGEPLVDLDLIQSSTSTSNEEQHIPYPERKRRDILGKTRVWLKVLINGHTVTQTPSTLLGNSFKAHFNYRFKVALKTWPKQLSLQVLEGSKLKQTLCATVFLQIPSSKVPVNPDFETAEFSSDNVVHQQGSSVGAGVSSSRGVIPFTTGTITYRMQWSLDKQGQVQAPKGPIPHWDGYGFHSRRNFFEPGAHFDMVQKWMELSHIDPNDPTNSHLMHLLKHPRFFSQENTAHFEVNSSEGDICTDAELDADIRLRVLHLRSQQLPEFKNLRLVPAIPSQILRKTVETYENRISDSKKNLKEELSIDIDLRWERVKLMLMSVRRHFQQKYVRAKEKTLQLDDIIHEEQIPDIGTLGNPLMSLLSARRPLKPQRKERGQVRGVVGLSEDQSVRLIIYIARAFHVPTRQDTTTNKGSDETPSIHRNGIVRPLVEVTFQRCVRTTSAAYGPNPTWNQQLTLPFRAPNDDFSPSSLQSVTDHIYLHMFDEVIHDLLEDERLRETTIHHRIEKRWLGSLKIPFSTLYLNNKIEGTFCLESPVILLGYTRSASVPVEGFDGEPSITHVSLYLTLEPTLPPPEPLMVHFESSEPEDVVAAGNDLVHSLSSRFPKRHFRTHTLNLSGKLVSLNRFIRPLKPPSQLISEESMQTVEQVAWYVSLIPSLADMTLFPGACNIWATSDFLNMLTGDEEEHAVLLTNFFLSLGKKAFLMIGTSIPEGVTCYVLTEEDNDWWAWNSSTGKHFSVRDAFSPLMAVYSLVNEDNIWFNVQKYDDPPRMNFDVKNSSYWKGFYSRSLHNPGMGSVQPSSLDFALVDFTQIERLQNHMELILRDAVMKWRSTIRTPWNRYANEVLRKMIVGLEEGQATGYGSSPDISLLSDIMRSHKVCGVCIHQGYSTMASLVEAVYSTGVHLNQAEGTEFSLVVHLHPYPGDVISVWVYVASLQRRNL